MKNLSFIIFAFFSLSIFSQQFKLSSSSSISVHGSSTILDWEVKAENFTGLLTVKAKKNSKSAIKKGSISKISLLIPVNSMRSEKGEIMDNKMHRALKMEDFPNIIYTLISTVEFESIDENKNTLRMSGILDIAGVEKAIETDVSVCHINDILSLTGEIQLKLSDFNIEPPSAMFGQIETGNDITINFTFEYKKH